MNQYDPSKHHRRSIRLNRYDYTRPGAYFFTLVTRGRACLFGQIVEEKMLVNTGGRIVVAEWQRLECVFKNIQLDTFIVMPNHVHGIININPREDIGEPINHIVGATHPCQNEIYIGEECLPDRSSVSEDGSPLQPDRSLVSEEGSPQRPNGPAPGSLGAMIGQFKSRATKRIWLLPGMDRMPIWQRNYYEQIIRDNASLERIRHYILENPLHWEEDEFFPPTAW